MKNEGEGMSFSAKRKMLNVFFCADDDIIIIDPEQEYSDICHTLNKVKKGKDKKYEG